MPPAYRVPDFWTACVNGSAFLIKGALDTARSDFRLRTEKEVLDFIAADGIEKPAFINTRPWEKNPNKARLVMIDAYSFWSGWIYGYLAFGLMTTGKWMIKSFKKNSDQTPLIRC